MYLLQSATTRAAPNNGPRAMWHFKLLIRPLSAFAPSVVLKTPFMFIGRPLRLAVTGWVDYQGGVRKGVGPLKCWGREAIGTAPVRRRTITNQSYYLLTYIDR